MKLNQLLIPSLIIVIWLPTRATVLPAGFHGKTAKLETAMNRNRHAQNRLQIQALQALKDKQIQKVKTLQKNMKKLKKEESGLMESGEAQLTALLKGLPALRARQTGKTEILRLKKATRRKVVWNPKQRPHLTIKLTVVMKKKISSKERKIMVTFRDRKGKTVSRCPFYLAVAQTRYRLKPGQTTYFFGNPKIHTLQRAASLVIE